MNLAEMTRPLVPEHLSVPERTALETKARYGPMWESAIGSAGKICAIAENERLDRVQGAATRLRDQLAESRAVARAGQPRPVQVVRLLIAGRALARELDILGSLDVLREKQDARMRAELDRRSRSPGNRR